jgi:hypothetical protein
MIDEWWVGKDVEGNGRDVIETRICLGRLRTTTTNLSPSRESTGAPAEYTSLLGLFWGGGGAVAKAGSRKL